MNSRVKQNLDWLFHFNKDKNDFINFINARGGNWAESLSELIQNLKRKGAQGIQDKFRNLGFNVDYAYIQLKPRFCELEVGNFILDKGEKVIFLEGQNSPDMISGIKKFDRVWEISTVFDSPELKNLWIEGNKIIRRWSQNVKCDIKLSLNLSGFQPEKPFHKTFDRIVKDSLNQLRKFESTTLNLGQTIEVKTLKKKKWTESEIDEWIRKKLQKKPSHSKRSITEKERQFDINRWVNFILEIINSNKATRIGILKHWYRYGLHDEEITIKRTVKSYIDEVKPEFLLELEEDVLYKFFPRYKF